MGPPEFTGGNMSDPLTLIDAPEAASMGPPEFTGGNALHPLRPHLGVFAELQWGRRNSPAETRPRGARMVPSHYASMGPPEFTGGNFRPMRNVTPDAPALQWGRRNSPAETPSIPGRSLPAPGVLQWGRRNSPAETEGNFPTIFLPTKSFNGAAGIHRRKHHN